MKALLLIDIQYDFLPGGALAVPKGDEIFSVVQSLLSSSFFDLVVASQDWHPVDHVSFADRHRKEIGNMIKVGGKTQILWPVHCVQGTRGAELSSDLDFSQIDKVIQKGTDSQIDSYSAFFDNGGKKSTGLSGYLQEKGMEELFVVGLASDYCVLYSVLDAIREGFSVTVVIDGCRGVNLQPGDVEVALQKMRDAGARLLSSRQLIYAQRSSIKK